MQSSAKWRFAARLAPLLAAIGLAGMVSCTDVTRPSVKSSDDWVEKTMVSLELRTQVSTISGGTITRGSPTMSRALVPVFIGANDPQGPMMSRAASGADVRHMRTKDGRLLSVARIRDANDRPVRKTYFFENGVIRAVESANYARYGRGWLRTSSRLSLFDSLGRPVAQVDTRSDSTVTASRWQRAASLRNALADATTAIAKAVAPTELHAEEIPCATEWFAVASASLVVAEFLAVLTTLAASCYEGVLTSCPQIAAAASKVLGAMGALNLAWDKLRECRQKIEQIQPPQDSTQYPNGGSNADESDPWVDEGDTLYRETLRTVDEFIKEAEAAGRFACSSDGNICLYYAE